MRALLDERNFMRAAHLGSVATVMAVPRILSANPHYPALPYVFVALLAMILVSAMATAWSRYGGMCGLLPERRRLWTGVAIGAAAGLAAYPIACTVDPVIRAAMFARGYAGLIEQAFPSTLRGVVALVLWAAGFESVFFIAATMSFFARLTNNQWAAVLGAAALRIGVTYVKLSQAQLLNIMPLVAIGVATTVVAAILYARAGLPAASVFVAVADARHAIYILTNHWED